MALAIIGTAGRGSDAKLMNRPLYDQMYSELLRCVDEWGVDSAVSGGAAFADHLAVRAFLDGAVKNLKLFLPAHFKNGRYVANPAIRHNPGATCNRYHEGFSRACMLDSLSELEEARRRGAVFHVFEGFHRRNTEVASAAREMIAFTFGTSNAIDVAPDHPAYGTARNAGLKDGGTAHTWEECYTARIKRHICLPL